VLAPAKDPRSDQKSSVVQTIIAALSGRVATITPGSVLGVGVYASTGQVRQSLLVCVLGPPAVVLGRVLAAWVSLLEPPKRWRRPRRRGT
jgi:hypothetical protein